MPPTDTVIAVTFRCNCRCTMCNIWQAPPCDEMRPEEYRRLPPSLRDINLSGGEPFLREDLPDIVRVLREACPRARIVISTNGLLADTIREMMRELVRIAPGIGVAVSLDGLGEIHDRIRGVDGACEKARQAVDFLLADGFRNLRLAYTATAGNADQITKVYALSRELGIQFTCAIAHTSEHYFQTDAVAPVDTATLRREADAIIASELRGVSVRRWGRAFFLHHLVRFGEGRGRPFPCRAGRDMFFLDPEGNLYPCNAHNAVMGSLRQQEFADLWQSPRAAEVRREVSGCGDGCWMVCSARTAMRHHKLRVLAWCLRRKFFGGAT